MRSRAALLLPIVIVACSASPPTEEDLGVTANALAEQTITCTASLSRAGQNPPAVIVATLVDPNVIAQRLPDVVTHDGPITGNQGAIRLTSAIFNNAWGFATAGGKIDFLTPVKLSSAPTTVALGVTEDTYLREGAPNQNQGALTSLRIREAGRNRALVRVDQSSLAFFTGVASARLDLPIVSNGDNWGSGRALAIYRLTQAWDEATATWSCPSDSDLTNAHPDCIDAGWTMGAGAHPWIETPTATATITNGQTGTVSFDVTADVALCLSHPELNFGWIIKKVNEDAPGLIELASREASTPPSLSVTSTAPDPADPWGPSYSATVQQRQTAGGIGPAVFETLSTTVTGGRFNFAVAFGIGSWRSSLTSTGPGVTFDRGLISCTGSTPILP